MNKKKILILGGFGFIGTNITEELINRGNWEVIIFEAEGAEIQNPDLLDKIRVYYGDFNRFEDYEKIFKIEKIDYVIHLISTTTPSSSIENIVYDIESNLTNTIKLLETIIKYTCQNILFLSSGGTVYGISEPGSELKETDPTNPISSYGIIKLVIEKYLYLYNRLHGLNYLILRPSNPYGEYHNNPRQGLLNVILKKILNNETIEIWGDGSVVRDFIYIKDLAKIIVALIEKDITNEVINVGTGIGFSVNQIIEIIRKEIGDFNIKYESSRTVDVSYSVLNIDKLKSCIDTNFTSIEEGIKRTYKWLNE